MTFIAIGIGWLLAVLGAAAIVRVIFLVAKKFGVKASPFCGSSNGTWFCNLLPGHTGHHKQVHKSGGCIGWRNK